jgi:hypothetical protein
LFVTQVWSAIATAITAATTVIATKRSEDNFQQNLKHKESQLSTLNLQLFFDSGSVLDLFIQKFWRNLIASQGPAAKSRKLGFLAFVFDDFFFFYLWKTERLNVVSALGI